MSRPNFRPQNRPHQKSDHPKPHSKTHSSPHARPHAGANGGPIGHPQSSEAPIAAAPAPLVATFAELALAEPLRHALAADGYERPTPIQSQAIPPALDGRDLLGIAQTGTGKTAAFALPILNRLLASVEAGVKPHRGRRPRALVLAPTRELAAQIAESFDGYGRHTPLRTAVIFGGVGQNPQVTAIRNGLDILVATPGRLMDLHQQRLVDLGEVEFFVLDEADRMLDMGFIEPIRKIAALLPRARQSMLFSATMPPEIRKLADSLLASPVTVQVAPQASTVDRIAQTLFHVLKEQKPALLVHLLATRKMERTVVFTKTKHGADRLTRKLKAAGIGADAIHGDKGQNQRIRALDAFRSGRVPVLVATDVAARGLDVDDVTHVVNYDLPMEPESYVHRIGRTARAGKSGEAISFCDAAERDLLKQVERMLKREIPRERMPDGLVLPTASVAARAATAPLAERGSVRQQVAAHRDGAPKRTSASTGGQARDGRPADRNAPRSGGTHGDGASRHRQPTNAKPARGGQQSNPRPNRGEGQPTIETARDRAPAPADSPYGMQRSRLFQGRRPTR